MNVYRAGDTLGGHVDDAEVDDTQAIVAVSLGCAGVFLLGGRTREEHTTAVMLRSASPGTPGVLTGEHRRQVDSGRARGRGGRGVCSGRAVAR